LFSPQGLRGLGRFKITRGIRLYTAFKISPYTSRYLGHIAAYQRPTTWYAAMHAVRAHVDAPVDGLITSRLCSMIAPYYHVGRAEEHVEETLSHRNEGPVVGRRGLYRVLPVERSGIIVASLMRCASPRIRFRGTLPSARPKAYIAEGDTFRR